MAQNKAPFGRRLLLFLAHLAVFLIAIFVGSTLLFVLLDYFSVSPNFGFEESELGKLYKEWSILLLSTIFALWLVHLMMMQRKLAARGFSLGQVKSSFVTGSLAAIILLFTFFGILWIGGWLHIASFDYRLNLLIGWFVFFLIQPFVEELMMRSFLQNQLHHFFGPMTGLIGSAIIFTLLHIANDHFSWIAGIQIFSGGILMGLLFLKYQSIWAAFAFHGCWNFFQSIVLGFTVSGIETYHLIHLELNGPDWLTGGAFGVEGSLLSFAMIVVAIIYFLPAAKETAPLAAAIELEESGEV